MLPPGVGTRFRWVITVGGLQSVPSAQLVSSYAPPAIHRYEVLGPGGAPLPLDSIPTAGGATVVLHGVNLGAEVARVEVQWARVPVLGVRVVIPHAALAFSTPPGEGVGVPVTVTVGGQSLVNGAVLMSYARPVVGRPSVLRVLGMSAMDCSRASATGLPTTGVARSAVLVLAGTCMLLQTMAGCFTAAVAVFTDLLSCCAWSWCLCR